MALTEARRIDLLGMAVKVASVHGGKDAHLLELRDVVEELAGEDFGELDREQIQSLLASARKLTDGYVLPDWACRTVTRYYTELAAIDRELSS